MIDTNKLKRGNLVVINGEVVEVKELDVVHVNKLHSSINVFGLELTDEILDLIGFNKDDTFVISHGKELGISISEDGNYPYISQWGDGITSLHKIKYVHELQSICDVLCEDLAGDKKPEFSKLLKNKING